MTHGGLFRYCTSRKYLAMVSTSPEATFCVYQNNVFKRKKLGVSHIVKIDGTMRLTAYADGACFELESSSIGGALKLVKKSPNGSPSWNTLCQSARVCLKRHPISWTPSVRDLLCAVNAIEGVVLAEEL